MTFEDALRLTEVLLALTLIQRGLEHLRYDALLFLPQIALAGLLLLGVKVGLVVFALWCLGLLQLHRLDGPYNGGSDKMVLLITTCLTAAYWLPTIREIALGYLAVQLVLSYFMSGWVKLRSMDWVRGKALSDVFAYSAYATSKSLQRWAKHPKFMQAGAGTVIAFEVLFPVSLAHPFLLSGALAIAFVFHIANSVLFGLNRFVWAWLSAYPSLVWLQGALVL